MASRRRSFQTSRSTAPPFKWSFPKQGSIFFLSAPNPRGNGKGNFQERCPRLKDFIMSWIEFRIFFEKGMERGNLQDFPSPFRNVLLPKGYCHLILFQMKRWTKSSFHFRKSSGNSVNSN